MSAFAVAATLALAEDAAPVRLGVLAHRGMERARQSWAPTVAYLDRQVPGYRFDLVPLDFDAVPLAVRDGAVEFLIANSAMFAELDARHGLSPIATMKNRHGERGYPLFGGVIFCRADQTGLDTLRDLKGRRFMAVDPTSFGGWRMAWLELRRQGLEIPGDLADLSFGGTHDAVVLAVLEGMADAGTVRTDTLERMAQEGIIALEQIRVLNQQASPTGFPLLHSTPLYPEWPVAKLPHTPDQLAWDVAAALIAMAPDSPAAIAAQCAGWTIPHSYQSVHDCLRELRIGPYADYGAFTLADVWRRYRTWLIAGMAAATALVALSVRVVRLNRIQKRVSRDLRRSESRLAATLASIGDGVIACDVQGRVVSLNPAAERLTGWTTAEAAGRNVQDVFHIVNAATRQPVENPIWRSLRDGLIVGLANHTILIARDGTERQIADSCAPIREQVAATAAGAGEAVGAVLVFRDVTEEYAKQRRIEESEAFLRSTIDALAHPFAVINVEDFTVELANEAFGGAAVIGRKCHQISHRQETPCGQAEHPCPVAEILRTGRPFVVQHTHLDGEGRARRIDVHAHPIRDANGRIVRIIEHSIDVTERERTLALLQARLDLMDYAASHSVQEVLEETLNTVGEFCDSPIGFYHFVDPDQRTLTLQAWSTRTRQEFCHAAGSQMHYPIEQAGVWVDCISQGQPVIHNDYASLPHRKGLPPGHAPVVRELVVPIMRAKRVVAILGVGNKPTDYTDLDVENVSFLADVAWEVARRKMAEEETDRVREQFELAVRGSNDGIWDWDLRTNALFLSPKWKEQLGYTDDELPNDYATFDGLLHPEDRLAVNDTVTRYLKGESTCYSVEFRLRHKDGSYRWILARGEAVRDAAGLPVRMAGSHTDITERKEAEAAQRDTLERYRLLADFSDDFVGLNTGDGRRLYISPSYFRKTGWTEAEVAEADWRTRIHPDDLARVERLRAANQAGEATRGEYRIRCKDGSWLWVDSHCKPVLDGEGRVVRMVVWSRDITAAKRAQERLEERDELLRKLSAQVPGLIYQYRFSPGTTGCLPYASAGIRDIYELTPEEVREDAAKVFERIHGADRARVMESIQRSYDDLTQWSCDYRVNLPARGLRWHRGVANPEKQADASVIWHGYIADVTERKQMEQALQESETRFQGIARSAHDAIIMMDGHGAISFWNPAAEAILGYRSEEVIGQDLHALLAPERYVGAYRAAAEEFRRSGRGGAVGRTLELAARRKDGQEIAVALSLSAVSLHGEWHAVGIMRDITAQKRAEAELRETNRQLEETTARANEMAVRAEMASIAKGEFLANMSHEIRTPLNGVIGMTGLLLDTDLTDDQRRFAEIVRSSGEALLALINDILDYSKIEAGKLELEVLDFDLQDCLEDLAATLAVRAHEKGLELLCSVDPGVPTRLRGDPGRLRQVLTNLTGNAIKFTHAGEVVIQVSPAPTPDSAPRPPERGIRSEPVMLRFSVRDTGIGIPPDKVGMLFDKFTQVDASTTRKYGGTGLGLAISKQLAELMGGSIGVCSPATSGRASEGGPGSEFWFTVCLDRQRGAGMDRDVPPADLRGVRALVVDDNATGREILIARLREWGMRPEAVESGPDALLALRQAWDAGAPFRLALIDMQMPGMDGEMVGRSIRADDRLAETCMVMLTSLGTPADTQHFTQIGFAAYLTKPVRHHDLRQVLGAVLAAQPWESGSGSGFPGTEREARDSLAAMAARLERRHGRILLAEDDTTNQQVAQGILRKFGLRADAVANGIEAVRALSTVPYDLVLMDVQMPEMDGIEATRQIRAPRSRVLNHAVPIIAMTAHALQGDRDRCLQAGMDDYVTKPIVPQALAEVLDRWLPEASSGAGLAKPRQSAAATPPPAGPQLPVWDRAALLDRLMGDEELAHTIMAAFLEDIPKQIAALRGFLDSGDAAAAGRQAHTIKGAAANVGAERLYEAALALEMAARSGALSGEPGGAAATLVQEFRRLAEAAAGVNAGAAGDGGGPERGETP